MNTGQRLVALSPLPSATALAHLLAIAQGTGTGATVFVSRMTVTTTTERTDVYSKPKREVQQAPERSTTSKQKAGKYAYALTVVPRNDVLITPDEVWVVTNKEVIGGN